MFLLLLFICVAKPIAQLLPNVATVVNESMKIGKERMTAYFETHVKKGSIPSTFNAARNAKLVMLEGNRSLQQ